MSLEVCVCVCEAGPGPGSLAASYFRYQSNYQLSLDCNNPALLEKFINENCLM